MSASVIAGAAGGGVGLALGSTGALRTYALDAGTPDDPMTSSESASLPVDDGPRPRAPSPAGIPVWLVGLAVWAFFFRGRR